MHMVLLLLLKLKWTGFVLSSKSVIYYTFTTFEVKDMLGNANICYLSSDMKNAGKARKYRLYRHLTTYEKII